jgi:hypothetical protein
MNIVMLRDRVSFLVSPFDQFWLLLDHFVDEFDSLPSKADLMQSRITPEHSVVGYSDFPALRRQLQSAFSQPK